MAAATKETKIYLSPVGRTTYLHIWTPKDAESKGKDGVVKKFKVYEGTMLFPFTDPNEMIKSAGLSEMLGLARETAQAKWKDLSPNTSKNGHKPGEWFAGLKSPFRFPDDDSYQDVDANKPKYHPEYKGMVRVPMRSYDIQPKVCYNDENRSIIELQTDFYSGCYAIASYRSWAYTNDSNGVSIGLNAYIKIRDGEPFSGGAPVDVMEHFKTIKPADLTDNSQMMLPDGV